MKNISRLLASSVLLTPLAQGAAFQLFERSSSGLGHAFSGGAAYAEDASVLASNPAAMIMLGGNWNISAGLNLIDVESETTGLSPNSSGGLSTVSGNADTTSYVPMLYVTKRVNENLVLGLGTFTTYGLKTEYPDSFADFAGTSLSELVSVNINPSIAYRVNEVITLGAGLDILYAEGNISSRSPDAVLAGTGNLFDLEGDDIAFGFNIGVLLELHDRLTFGLHYRSSIELGIEGEAALGTGLNNIAGGAVVIPGTYDASLDVELPETVEASLTFKASKCLDLHADVFWTNWDKVPTLSPKVNGTLSDAAVNSIIETTLNWESTFRYAVGATYRPNEKWTLRAGVAYDQSPVEDDNRTLRIPDRDRIWLSAGFTYHFADHYSVDFGYSHLFADDVTIDPNEPFYNGTISGDADLFAISFNAQFD
ncbi:MAG: outer membrane protein transport protein [Verrucomicrobiota bacterium]